MTKDQEDLGGGLQPQPNGDLSAMSQQELDDLARSLLAELTHLKEARRATVERSEAVVAERARRRDRLLEETYAERRRNAVLAGDGLPPLPPSLSGASVPTTAARRLAGLVIVAPRAAEKEVGSAEIVLDAPVAPGEIRGTGVSDHAIVRYMERVHGIDMDHVRSQILTPQVRGAIAAGMSRIRTPEGVIVFRDGTVISFLPPEAGVRRPRKVARGKIDSGWGNQDVRLLDLSED